MLQRLTAFRRHNPISRQAMLCGVAGMLACALVLGGSLRAIAADDDEEDSFETKIFKSLLGIEDRPPIEYRERSPLVVPPSADLPAPSSGVVATGQAWPKDPERQPKKKKAASANSERKKDWDEQARPLSPAELDRGRRAGAGLTPTNSVRDERGAPLRPDEMGYKGGLLGALFKSGDKDAGEVATFAGEPPRTDLTAPPAGYRTPSPAQPYGLGAKKEAPKPLTREEQVTRF